MRGLVLRLAVFVIFLPSCAMATSIDAKRRSVSSGPGYTVVTPEEGGWTWVLYQYATPRLAAEVYIALAESEGGENVVMHTAPNTGTATSSPYFVARRLFLQVIEPAGAEWEWKTYPTCCTAEGDADYLAKPEPKGKFSTPDGQLVVYWLRLRP